MEECDDLNQSQNLRCRLPLELEDKWSESDRAKMLRVRLRVSMSAREGLSEIESARVVSE